MLWLSLTWVSSINDSPFFKNISIALCNSFNCAASSGYKSTTEKKRFFSFNQFLSRSNEENMGVRHGPNLEVFELLTLWCTNDDEQRRRLFCLKSNYLLFYSIVRENCGRWASQRKTAQVMQRTTYRNGHKSRHCHCYSVRMTEAVVQPSQQRSQLEHTPNNAWVSYDSS